MPRRDAKTGRFLPSGKSKSSKSKRTVRTSAGQTLVVVDYDQRKPPARTGNRRPPAPYTNARRIGMVAVGALGGSFVASTLAERAAGQPWARWVPAGMGLGGLALAWRGPRADIRMLGLGAGAIGLGLLVGQMMAKDGKPALVVAKAGTAASVDAFPQEEGQVVEPAAAGLGDWAARVRALGHQVRAAGRLAAGSPEATLAPGALGRAQVANGTVTLGPRPGLPAGRLASGTEVSPDVWTGLDQFVRQPARRLSQSADPYRPGQVGRR